MSDTRQTAGVAEPYAAKADQSTFMHNEASRRDNRLVVVADDDSSARGEQVRALEGAGLHAASTPIDAGTGLVVAGTPCAIVLSLATDAGLQLLLGLARLPQASQIPVIVSACHSELARVRAEQAGSVAVFLDQPAPSSVVAAVLAVIGLGTQGAGAEFPAPCPRCSERTGMPRSVSTAATAATYVGLECGSCGQSWRIRRLDAAPPTPQS